MTTADIAFTQPANPDRLRDYEQDARTVFWALLVAILIHLFVAFLLAAFSGFFSPAPPTPEKPIELTFMDLSPTSPKNSAFIETDESKKAPEPKDKTFESNANSIGASELAAAGEMPLPSQTGKDRPLMDFETNQVLARQQGRAGAAETGIATEGCATCRATRADYCCGAICVADSKVSVCARCRGRIIASAVGVSSAKGAEPHRGQHYQPRDFIRERFRHTAGPISEDRGRFDWVPLVHICGAEA